MHSNPFTSSESLFKFFTIITIQVNAERIKTNLPSPQMQSGVCFMTVKTHYWPDSALCWASYIENYSTPSDTSKPHSSKPGDSGCFKCKALSEGNSLVKAFIKICILTYQKCCFHCGFSVSTPATSILVVQILKSFVFKSVAEHRTKPGKILTLFLIPRLQ